MSEGNVTDNATLTVLAAGAAALARATDLDTALAIIVEAGAAAVGASFAAVFASEPDRGGLELLVTLGMAEEAATNFEIAVVDNPEHPLHRAALDRTGSLGRRSRAIADDSPITAADLPLVVAGGGGETCVGVLSFAWPGEHEVDTTEETLLVGIADLAAAAVNHFRVASMISERAEWFERIAHTDALTGLANARTLARVLELEVARARRAETEVSVAVFDIDGFTALNEAAGARAGDFVLRQVAAVLAESVRLVDTIARTGGDEFVVVAPGSAGVTVARRVIAGVAKLDPVEGHQVTVSVGIAEFPRNGSDAEAVLFAARNAVEAADGLGRIMEAGK